MSDMRASSGMAGTAGGAHLTWSSGAPVAPGRRWCPPSRLRPRPAWSPPAPGWPAGSACREPRAGRSPPRSSRSRRRPQPPDRRRPPRSVSVSACRRTGASAASTLRRAVTRVGVVGGLEGLLHLVLEAARQSPEVAHRLAELAGGVGQPLWAQHDQGDQQDDDELATPDVEHRPSVPVAPGGSGATQAAGGGPGISGGRANLGDRHLHLAEASQLDLQVGGCLGDPPELHQRQHCAQREGHRRDGPEQRDHGEVTTESNQPSSWRRRWKSMRSSWLIGSPTRGSKSSAGQLPLDERHPRGHQHVDDPTLGRLHHGHLAGRAAEHVAALVVLGADPHLEVVHGQLDISAVVTARLDHRCHVARPSRPFAWTVRRVQDVGASTLTLEPVWHNGPSCPLGCRPSVAPRSASPTGGPGPTPPRTPSRPSPWPCASGATGLESDVWLTRDGEAVLDHDGVVRNGLRRRPIASCDRHDLPDHIPTLERAVRDGRHRPRHLARREGPGRLRAHRRGGPRGGRRRARAASGSATTTGSRWRTWRAACPEVRLVDSTFLGTCRRPRGAGRGPRGRGHRRRQPPPLRVDRRPHRPLPPLRGAVLRLGRAARSRSSTTSSTPGSTPSTATTSTAWSTPWPRG